MILLYLSQVLSYYPSRLRAQILILRRKIKHIYRKLFIEDTPLSSFRVYFKFALFCRTPLIILMDLKYKTTDKRFLLALSERLENFQYIKDFRDCDNASFMYKGLADGQTNAVGIVIGWAKWANQLHLWNIALTDKGIYQIEPQGGRLFRRDGDYIPLVVII